MAKRIQRKRTKGWRMPEGVVYVGRPSRYGNPFVVGGYYFKGDSATDNRTPFQLVYTRAASKEHADERFTLIETVDQALEWYRWYLNVTDWKFLEDLRGKDLACWCALGEPCHGDVLLERVAS